MKSVELKLIAELMKNSRRSDRELSKAIGVSQPTVTRLRVRLEKEGYIKEYTMIPDFCKLGYRIMAITFALSRTLDKEEADKAKKLLADGVKGKQFEFIMLERGRGLGFDGVIISLHEDYSSYLNVLKWLRQFDFLDVAETDSFLVSLDDKVRYRPLTFSTLATCLLSKERKHEP
jgi:DNA-binding Lrp family transcriptional regulator